MNVNLKLLGIICISFVQYSSVCCLNKEHLCCFASELTDNMHRLSVFVINCGKYYRQTKFKFTICSMNRRKLLVAAKVYGSLSTVVNKLFFLSKSIFFFGFNFVENK